MLGKDLDPGRLAGAVRAEQTEQLSWLDGERDATQCGDLVDPALQPARAGTEDPTKVVSLDRAHASVSDRRHVVRANAARGGGRRTCMRKASAAAGRSYGRHEVP